jgi:UDP-N-acetylmuramate-alanine ligase
VGVHITIGHSAENIKDVDYVIRSSAIPDEIWKLSLPEKRG